MSARNNSFLHSLKPEILKKWIFISSSAKGILTCCIMHSFPQMKKKKKRIFKTPLIAHSGIKTRSPNSVQLFLMYRKKWHVSVTISNTKTWCSLSWKNRPRYQNYLWLTRTGLLRRKVLLLSLVPQRFFLAAKQSLGALGSDVSINPQHHLFLGNSVSSYFLKQNTQGWNILS